MSGIDYKTILLHDIVDLLHDQRSVKHSRQSQYAWTEATNLAASIPKVFSTSRIWFEYVFTPLIPWYASSYEGHNSKCDVCMNLVWSSREGGHFLQQWADMCLYLGWPRLGWWSLLMSENEHSKDWLTSRYEFLSQQHGEAHFAATEGSRRRSSCSTHRDKNKQEKIASPKANVGRRGDMKRILRNDVNVLESRWKWLIKENHIESPNTLF